MIAVSALTTVASAVQDPLRIYIRSGPKSHGPGAHDYPRFLKEWVPLLNARGAKATGAEAFPTREQLAQTDVLVLHAQEAGNIDGADRENLNAFLARGGGLVVIHAASVSKDTDWYKTVIGGSWRDGTTKWLEGPMHLYFVDRLHPITEGVSNWEMDDEIYYDMDMLPEARILAAAYTPKPAGARDAKFQKRAEELTGGGKRVSIYDVQPQMWTYERTADGGKAPYRAFVSIPGHLYENFNRPNYRGILLRGIAWAGKRDNVDALLTEAEKGDGLRYVADGPIHPSKAAESIEVHPEFDLTLVASEPLISKPMNIDWDEKGRLWVAETPEYPNGRREPNVVAWKDTGSLQPRMQPREPVDTISILTDTNGDGLMDKRHVFADKLELITGFVFHRNGVIVATAPDIWFIEDTDGDEVADKRTKLYTGLGIFDTHAVINNLRWGLDGWVYATHGYSVGEVTSPDGKTKFGRDGSGVVRFKPDGSAFEQYSSRNGNTWGLDITWDGQVFWTQPTSGTVFFHTVLPEHVLAKGRIPGTTSWKGMISGQETHPLLTYDEQAYVQIDQVGQFTAAAGCAIYDGGAWPDRWRHSYFTAEPTINIVHHSFVDPEGISYTTRREKGRENTEFIRGRDMWFRPIETRIGPDGALYLIDFYNQAVMHNDTRGPLHGPANAAVRPDRDHYFGRIWRVQHKQAKKLDVPVLDRKNLDGLMKAMEHPNAHVRFNAYRLAREQQGTAQGAKLNRPMGSQALAVHERARAAKSEAERRAMLDTFATAADNWTKSAIVAAAAERPEVYLADAFRYPKPEAMTELVSAVVPTALPAKAGALLVLAAKAPKEAAGLKAALAQAVGRMESGSVVMDAATTDAVRTLLDDPATTAAALPVVARWDEKGALRETAVARAKALLGDLKAPGLSDDRRAEIAGSLLAMKDYRKEALSAVTAMILDPGVSDSQKSRLLETLGDRRAEDVDAALVSMLAKTQSAAVFEQIVRRPESSLALVRALNDGTIKRDSLGQAEVARLQRHPDRNVQSAAEAYFDKVSPAATAKSEIVAKLAKEVGDGGDAARGKVLFTAACATCHKLGDVGKADIGPPLTGMGAHPRSELLTHIVDPNGQVDPSFWQWNITTKRGETLVGIIASENAAGVTLRSPGGDVQIRNDEIASRENTRRSFMPEGFESLGAEALRDILSFLAVAAGEPGKTAPAGAPGAKPAQGAKPPASGGASGPKEGGKGDAPLPEVKPVSWEPGKLKVLIVAGGSAHDFGKFFGEMDGATLRNAGFSVNYTEDRDQAATELKNADVAVVSVNRQHFDTPAWRKALMDFAASGKGLVMLHPGTWYGFPDWPELNASIVGGGARGHDKIAKFSVNAVQAEHPILKGVPKTFEVEDELYYINPEPGKVPTGSAKIEVLAETSPSVKYGKPHPSVWTTSHPSARVVGIALGHDERVHDHPAFKTLLVNAVRWAGNGKG